MIRAHLKAIPAVFAEQRIIRCPKCHVAMSSTFVAGISIEKCPQCEGTFFDKGEVERLVRRKIKLDRYKAFRIFSWS